MSETSEGLKPKPSLIKRVGSTAARIVAIGALSAGARAVESKSPTQPIRDVENAARAIGNVIFPGHASTPKLVENKSESTFENQLDQIYSVLSSGKQPDFTVYAFEMYSFVSGGDSYFVSKTNDGREYLQIRFNPFKDPEYKNVKNFRIEKGALQELPGAELTIEAPVQLHGITNPPLHYFKNGRSLNTEETNVLSQQLSEAFKKRDLNPPTGETIPSPYPPAFHQVHITS